MITCNYQNDVHVNSHNCLKILSAKHQRDEGKYTCVAENGFGPSDSQSISAVFNRKLVCQSTQSQSLGLWVYRSVRFNLLQLLKKVNIALFPSRKLFLIRYELFQLLHRLTKATFLLYLPHTTQLKCCHAGWLMATRVLYSVGSTRS